LSEFLVDTSAWVSFLRGDAEAVSRVDPLLAECRVAISGPVYAEVLSGMPNRVLQNRLRTLFRSFHWLAEPADVWDRVADVRFALAPQGYQATLVDVLIALAAAETGVGLLTRDRDFERIRRVLPLNLFLF